MKTPEKVFFIFGLGKIGEDIYKKLLTFEDTRCWEVYGWEIDPKKIDDKKVFFTQDFKVIYKEKFLDDKYLNSQFIYIINVPTNIIELTKRPDTYPFEVIKRQIKNFIKTDDILINQSTVYPGFTVEFGLQAGFKYIYMIPERYDETNPNLNFDRIMGSFNPEYDYFIKDLYERMGYKIHKVVSVENAEASKLLENIQRDVNIALMNEFKNCIEKMNQDLMLKLDMNTIIDCASTKKNFYKVKPGLVGGHCIPYDPYWFIYKAEYEGANPKLIKLAREINEEEIEKTYIKIIETILKEDHYTIAIHGITYKKGSKDYRHSPTFKILEKLQKLNLPYNRDIYIWDEDLTRDEVEEIRKSFLPLYMNYYDLKDKSKISKYFYLKEL